MQGGLGGPSYDRQPLEDEVVRLGHHQQGAQGVRRPEHADAVHERPPPPALDPLQHEALTTGEAAWYVKQ